MDLETLNESFLGIQQDRFQRTEAAPGELASILGCFRNLDSIRVVVEEDVDFIAGWITREQFDFLNQLWHHYVKINQGEDESEYGFWFHPEDFFDHFDGAEIPMYIVEALSLTDLTLKELRFSANFIEAPVDRLALLPRSLRTLRIALGNRHFMSEEYDQRDNHGHRLPPFLTVLASLVHLQDVALMLPDTDQPEQLLSSESRRKAEGVFSALAARSSLRRFALKGDWTYTESAFLTFFEWHASSLRGLLLYGNLLHGEWLRVLQRLSGARLQWLIILFPCSVRLGDEVVAEDFSTYNMPSFIYATRFEPKDWDEEWMYEDELSA